MRLAIIAAALGLAALPAIAQTPPSLPKEAPGKPDPSRVVAGSYAIEPSHTQVSFSLDHMGFTPFMGVLSDASGTLTIDPKKLAAAKLSVSVPIKSIYTTSAKLTEELISPQFFDAATYPTATFVSTKVTPLGPLTADVTGNLTLHGVTKPVTLKTKFYGAGTNFMSKKPSVASSARARSSAPTSGSATASRSSATTSSCRSPRRSISKASLARAAQRRAGWTSFTKSR